MGRRNARPRFRPFRARRGEIGKGAGRGADLPLGLPEEPLHGFHRQEQTIAPLRKRDEIEVPVETPRVVIHGVDQDDGGGNFRRSGEGPVQCVHQQDLAKTPAPVTPIDGKTAKQRRRNDRVSREFSCNIFGQIPDVDAEGGKRIIAKHGLAAGRPDQHERGGDMAAGILPGLVFQIAVERRLTA